ncbi:MAG: hypothetical protein DRP78_02120 [Candidatus Omnitrophota bacterium]|nr:MAG: hypothetical protein DRP78_02120 [Candidatus Omnitrophota bacterium]
MRELFYLINPWWENKKFDIGIMRQKYLSRLIKSLKHKRAVLVTGSRRVGKTTLLKQLINHLIFERNIKPRHILYVLLDHPRLAKVSLLEIVTKYRTTHLLSRAQKIYLFFDEVQYIKNWEQAVKSLIDTENVKVFLSGSASAEIFQKTSFLTGRYEKVKIDPLDFKEFLQFKNVSVSPIEDYKYEAYLEKYLKVGGYPEYVLQRDDSYFTDLLEAIIFKDIVYTHGIKNPDIVRDLILLLSDRNGHQTSYTKLSKILSLSVDTTKEYVTFLRQTFIVEEIERFSRSRSKKIYSAKKFYLHDVGLLHDLSSKFNLGSAVENILFKFLSGFFKTNFYYENQKEVDFVFKNRQGDFVLVESKFISYEKNIEEKDIETIIKVAQELKAKTIFFITRNLKKREKREKIIINWIPLHKLLRSDFPLRWE